MNIDDYFASLERSLVAQADYVGFITELSTWHVVPNLPSTTDMHRVALR